MPAATEHTSTRGGALTAPRAHALMCRSCAPKRALTAPAFACERVPRRRRARAAADLDNIGEPHGARHGAGAHSELEREAAKALGELSRVQAELRALAPHVGHGGTAAARERDSEYDDPRDGPSDDEGAREGEGEEQAGQSSERPPTAPRSHTRLKGALGSADRDGTDLLAFATPGGGAGSRARRAAAFGSPAPGTPRAAEAHGRAPDKLGLHLSLIHI